MNDYFEHTTKLVPGTKARAEDVNSRFDGVVDGFEKLPAPHATLQGFSDPVPIGAPTALTDAASVDSVLGGGNSFGTDTGIVNAYVVDLPIAPSSYRVGLTFNFKAVNGNTGPATVNLNSLGIKTLSRPDGSALVSGDIANNQMCSFAYDGTKFLAVAAFKGQFDELVTAAQLEVALAAASATSAGDSETQTGLDAVATAADRVQTGLDVIATGADLVSTNADVVTATTQAGIATTKAGEGVTTYNNTLSIFGDAVAVQAAVDAAEADKVQTGLDRVAVAADLVATNQDTIDTAADVVAAEADKVQTGLDRIAVAADLVQTNQDTIDTAADLVATNQDTLDTAADLVLTNADVVLTGLDVVSTNADLVLTNADVVLTGLDVVTTNADAATTTQDAIDTAADVVTTNADAATTTQDAIDTAADVVLTNADVVLTHADVVLTNNKYDEFDDRYLGAKAVDPTLDNDGGALITGALYFNTVTNAMKVYSGTAWGDLASLSSVTADTFTGGVDYTAGTTTQLVISETPASENSTFVTFDGVAQHKSQYSLSGATITFGVAIPIGVLEVEVLSFISVDQGTVADGSITHAKLSSEVTFGPEALTAAMIPTNWREVIRTGWTPAWFNQQWGGAPWGNAYEEVATGNAVGGSGSGLFRTTAEQENAFTFQVSRDLSVGDVDLFLSKAGTISGNISITICSDSAGEPGATLGTSGAVNGNTVGSVTSEVRFTFASPVAISAGTTYWINVSATYAISNTNYLVLSSIAPSPYPFSKYMRWNGTAWSELATWGGYFKLIPTTSTADGYLNCYEGSPLNQSGAVTRKVQDCFIGDTLSYSFKADTITNSKPLLDMVYGLEADRIHLAVVGGVLVLKVFEEDGTVNTATGTTSVTGLNKTIGVVVTTAKAEIWLNGVLEATVTAAMSFSDDFRNKGTVIVGGGMPEGITWTKETDMSVLPSADGWTYGGSATEANAYSVIDGKLYQNANGVGLTENAYYNKTFTFNNTTGWLVAVKLSTQGNIGGNTLTFDISDGTKKVSLNIQKGFIAVNSTGSAVNVPCKSLSESREILILGKGSDLYIFIDGCLLYDGTGLLTTTTAGNDILFGDTATVSAINADVVWDHINQAESWNPPEYTTASIYDLAFWSKDMSAKFADLHADGLEQTIGLHKLPTVERVQSVSGIESEPTTTSVSSAALADMQQFVLGNQLDISMPVNALNSAITHQVVHSINVDGVEISSRYFNSPGVGYQVVVAQDQSIELNSFGVHYVGGRWRTSGGTLTAAGTRRTLITRSK